MQISYSPTRLPLGKDVWAKPVQPNRAVFAAMALGVRTWDGWQRGRTTISNRGAHSSCLRCLLPSARRPGRNPTNLFLNELKRRLDARTSAEVIERNPELSGLDQSTIDRWSAGTHMRDEMTLRLILRAYGLDQPDELLYAQLVCSRHIQLLGHLAQGNLTR